MKKTAIIVRYLALAATAIVPAVFGTHLLAAPPQANAVPFVASSPTTPHTSWSGNPVTLKGTLTSTAFPADTFTYDWDPGNGAAHCTGTVTDQFVIECPVTYTGAVGTVFNALLVITDTTTSQVSPPANCPPSVLNGACYYTSLNNPPPNLPVEVNNAIDNGLWYLHTKMIRTTSAGGAPIGNWNRGDGSHADASQAGTGVNSLDCTAFMVSGFLQTNVPVNPYSLDVGLCTTGVFDQLTTIAVFALTDPVTGPFDPDSNGNHIGVEHNGNPENYQTGMMMDAIIAMDTRYPGAGGGKYFRGDSWLGDGNGRSLHV